jgi:hypothetical protein
LRIGTAGFYNFVLARPTIDPVLHPIQIPNTSLHEIAHSYGVASESSANFIAYIAGRKAKISVLNILSNYPFEDIENSLLPRRQYNNKTNSFLHKSPCQKGYSKYKKKNGTISGYISSTT